MIQKTILAAALALSAFAVAPASAQMDKMGKMDCSEASMKSAKADMMKMSDGEKKTMAMKHMKMADEAMMKKDEKGCMMHMEEAHKSMM